MAGFTTIPLVYALTYGIGKVMDRYVKEKIKVALTKEQMMQTFKEERKKGKKKEKENKEKIIKKSKEFK